MSEKYYCLNPDNFHKVSNSGKGILNSLTDIGRQEEYENSNFYKTICNKLYNDGIIQIEYLKQLISEKKKELLKSRDEFKKIETLYFNRQLKSKKITKYEYDLAIINIDDTIDYRINSVNNRLKKANDRLEVTQFVFGNGFDHFMNITKEYGNCLNGIKYIQSVCMADNVVAYALSVYKSRFEVVI